MGAPKAIQNSDRTLRVITQAYTVAYDDDVLFADATGGAFTITLQAAAQRVGLPLTIRSVTTGTNVVTVQAAGSDLIEGSSSTSVGAPASTAPYLSIELLSDGSAWRLV